jgi:hypothetical protein
MHPGMIGVWQTEGPADHVDGDSVAPGRVSGPSKKRLLWGSTRTSRRIWIVNRHMHDRGIIED